MSNVYCLRQYGAASSVSQSPSRRTLRRIRGTPAQSPEGYRRALDLALWTLGLGGLVVAALLFVGTLQEIAGELSELATPARPIPTPHPRGSAFDRAF